MTPLRRYLRTRGVRHGLEKLVFGYLSGAERWVLFYDHLDGPPAPASHGDWPPRAFAASSRTAAGSFTRHSP